MNLLYLCSLFHDCRPYFPASGALLYATAMMAQGWDGSTGAAPGFPDSGWNVRTEGLSKAL